MRVAAVGATQFTLMSYFSPSRQSVFIRPATPILAAP